MSAEIKLCSDSIPLTRSCVSASRRVLPHVGSGLEGAGWVRTHRYVGSTFSKHTSIAGYTSVPLTAC